MNIISKYLLKVPLLAWIIIVFFAFISLTCSVRKSYPYCEWKVTVEYTSGSVVTDTIILPWNVTYKQNCICTNFYTHGRNLFGFKAVIPKCCGSIQNTIRIVSMDKLRSVYDDAVGQKDYEYQ